MILNASHMRRHAMVMRLIGANRDTPHWFSSWAPKAFTAIGPIKDDQISSRTIRIELERKPSGVRKEPARMRNIERAGAGLRARCARWMSDNALRLRSTEVPEIDGLSDRIADNWEPLLAVATLIGDDIYREALAAAGTHIDDAESVGELLLAHIHELFEATGMPDAISTEDILRHLVDRDDGPWPRWWGDKVGVGNIKSAGAALAKKLKPYKKMRVHQDPRGGRERSEATAGNGPRTRVGLVCSPNTAGKRRNNGTPQVDRGEETEHGTEPVPSTTEHGVDPVPSSTEHGAEPVPLFQASDLQRSVVPSFPGSWRPVRDLPRQRPSTGRGVRTAKRSVIE